MFTEAIRMDSSVMENKQRVSLIAHERREHHRIARGLDDLTAKRTTDSWNKDCHAIKEREQGQTG